MSTTRCRRAPTSPSTTTCSRGAGNFRSSSTPPTSRRARDQGSRATQRLEVGEVGLSGHQVPALVLRVHDRGRVVVVREADSVPELVSEDALELLGADECEDSDALPARVPNILPLLKGVPGGLVVLRHLRVECGDTRVIPLDGALEGARERAE